MQLFDFVIFILRLAKMQIATSNVLGLSDSDI